MPLGKYPTFDDCVNDYMENGKSKKRANRICRALEIVPKKNRPKGPIYPSSVNTNIKYEEGDRFYIKAFLMDASENINRWGVNPTSLQQHINTFIGKPLVLTEDFNHPMPPDFDRVAASESNNQYYDDDDNPHNIVKVDDIVEHWLAYQEDFRVGNIIDITNKNDVYYAIIEITDPQAKEAFRNNDVPLFVSPAIAQLDVYENPASITKWTGVHLAIVSNPAYTIKKALVTGQCHESGDNKNDTGKCLLQLRQASVINKDSNQKTLFGCGFCRGAALADYAEIVENTSNVKSQKVSTHEEFLNYINSSNEKLDPRLKIRELTDQPQEQPTNNKENTENNSNTNNKKVIKEQNNTTVIEENQQSKSPRVNPETGQPYPGDNNIQREAEILGIKVAGMEECVQIFTQNGVTPDQSVQICKLAAKALMENQQQGQPNPAGGKTQGNGPGISGQFGSVTDYEKEIAKQEVKIAQLTEELRNYKKGDKTDAQRIAELEETVSKLNTNLKEKELEAYLVTKISDVELRNKKIKRFAELNMSIEDLKDIYDDKVNTDPKVVTKKTASVQSPESKVKLQVASTSEEGEESQVNDIRNRNNRISSLLSKGRLQ